MCFLANIPNTLLYKDSICLESLVSVLPSVLPGIIQYFFFNLHWGEPKSWGWPNCAELNTNVQSFSSKIKRGLCFYLKITFWTLILLKICTPKKKKGSPFGIPSGVATVNQLSVILTSDLIHCALFLTQSSILSSLGTSIGRLKHGPLVARQVVA